MKIGEITDLEDGGCHMQLEEISDREEKLFLMEGKEVLKESKDPQALLDYQKFSKTKKEKTIAIGIMAMITRQAGSTIEEFVDGQ